MRLLHLFNVTRNTRLDIAGLLRRTTAFAEHTPEAEVLDTESEKPATPKTPKTPAAARSPGGKPEASPSLKDQEPEILLQGMRDSAVNDALSLLEANTSTTVPRWAKVRPFFSSLLSHLRCLLLSIRVFPP